MEDNVISWQPFPRSQFQWLVKRWKWSSQHLLLWFKEGHSISTYLTMGDNFDEQDLEYWEFLPFNAVKRQCPGYPSFVLDVVIDHRLARKPHEEEKENKIDQRRKEGCSSHFNLSCKRRNNPSFSFSCPAVFSKKIIRKSWPSGDYHSLFGIFTSREMGQGLNTTRKSPSLWNCLQREVNFKSFFPLPFWDMVSWNRRSFRIVTYKPY